MGKPKIGYVLQPWDKVDPLITASVSIVSYEVSTRVAKENDVIVFQNGSGKKVLKKKFKSINLYSIPTGYDRYLERYIMKYLYRIFYKKSVPYYYSILYYFVYISLISFYARKHKIDILHVANFGNFTPILRLLNPKAKIILHMHCEWLTMMDSRLIKKQLKRINHVVSCSNFVTNKNNDKFNIRDKSSTIYNGIDTKIFDTKEKKILNHLLYVGRISPEKGIHTLLEALPSIKRVFPGVKLSLIGSKNQLPYDMYVKYTDDNRIKKLKRFYTNPPSDFYYYNYLNDFAREHDLLDNITFLGAISNRELPYYYQNATIFICPSVFNETFALTPLEAMSTGTPVIGTKSGGLVEAVQNGVNGMLIDKEDGRQLADSIIYLLSNPDILKKYGNNGRKIIESNFTWDKIAGDFMNLYQKLYNE